MLPQLTNIPSRRVRLALALALMFPVVMQTARAGTPDWKRYLVLPLDSAEARQVRIWVPVAHRNPCAVTIAIMNRQGDTLRHFVTALMRRGYYNFYWDKKDDSGRFVSPG
ncbi:MAG: hypothetical protein D6800_00015, partial [Candidatus Zixiibacteriota bacterium]